MSILFKAKLTSSLAKVGVTPLASSCRRIILCNRSAGSVSVRLACTLPGADTPNDEDYILYDTPIDANKSLLINETELNTGGNVAVFASASSSNISLTAMD